MSFPKYVFCPRCHKRINTPKIAGQIQVESGFITLQCVDKNCSEKGGKVNLITDKDAYKKHKQKLKEDGQ